MKGAQYIGISVMGALVLGLLVVGIGKTLLTEYFPQPAAPMSCEADTYTCPNGIVLSRIPPACTFAACDALVAPAPGLPPPPNTQSGLNADIKILAPGDPRPVTVAPTPTATTSPEETATTTPANTVDAETNITSE